MSGINNLSLSHGEYNTNTYLSSKGFAVDKSFEIKDSEKAQNNSKILGMSIIKDPVTNFTYEIKAEYEDASTQKVPMVKVSLKYETEIKAEYYINLNEVDPKNASEIEMFALCSYADSTENNIDHTVGNWNTLKNFQENTAIDKEFVVVNSVEDVFRLKQDWTVMVQDKNKELLDGGLYKQLLDGKKLLSMFEKYGVKTEFDDISKQIKSTVKKFDKDFVDPTHAINVIDVDDGYASIEIYGTGEIHYLNRLNENASWGMELSSEQLQKVTNLIHNSGKYKMYMCDKSFWESYINGNVSLKDIENIDSKINNKKTYRDIVNQFSDTVKRAWERAEAESGTNGFGTDDKGNILYLSEFTKKYIATAMKGGNLDLLGNTKESVLKFAKEMIDLLNDSSQPLYNSELQKLKDREKLFYESLVNNLVEQ